MQPSLRRLAASALSEAAASQSTAAASVAAIKTPKPSEVAGFYPKRRPEPQEEKKGFRGWKPFAAFLAFNALPIGYAVYYFRNSVENKYKELADNARLAYMNNEQALQAARELTKRASQALLVTPSGEVVNVAPHVPEERALKLPSEPIVKGVPKNQVTDSLMAEYTGERVPFNMIHFAVSSSSLPFGDLPGSRNISLIYMDASTGRLLTVQGTATEMDDDDMKRFYWRQRWGEYMAEDKSDYLLLRMRPEVITLRSTGPSERHWTPVRVRRTLGDEWELTSPMVVENQSAAEKD
ncbi:hypothetical protein FOL47_007158 [Perkinsus chesapeaki]|uniref:Uncharacterized protein n=1 Tax=Perkinsus chesapeaki TaxID=330153 RepID=A0A7J6LMN7_PERCH|nr:hypothetical protein FOL47_007158 [Perkinsus chesapeaki]